MSTLLINAPISGQIVPLDQVPDPVFSQRMLGDGVAILPTAGAVLAPAAGQIEALFPTGHALGIRTPEGVEILIHLGVDSSRLEAVFRPRVRRGATVAAGDLLVEFDLTRLAAEARSPLVPVIITALPAGWRIAGQAPAGSESVAGGRPILTLQQGGTPDDH